jgi:hypothetical protein
LTEAGLANGPATRTRSRAATTPVPGGAIAPNARAADIGRPGDRWDGADPPPLERILFHLLQEYARHVGRVDIVSELASGQTGE